MYVCAGVSLAGACVRVLSLHVCVCVFGAWARACVSLLHARAWLHVSLHACVCVRLSVPTSGERGNGVEVREDQALDELLRDGRDSAPALQPHSHAQVLRALL